MKKSFKAALMVVLCAGGLTAAFAFNKSTSVQKVGLIAYTYNLGTSTGARNASNWTQATGSTPSCGAAGSVPCKVVFDSSVYPTLQDYINDQHFASDAEVAYGPGVVSKQ
ncbi:hypothetical protein [Pedobacter sp.]|jgi:hypothetical protein|uniref:hypothetical protein n=1 Tax=Pedobacter sp. TaxID=1411316 RepID=UPI002C8F9DD7|nr:hypothetical protein [Pedobacter sp.]HWW40735.1 hypothetical protein [Pedobacter sp.]